MEVFSFNSADDKVKITAATAADLSANWVRFKSRVNDAKHPDAAMTYCDYRSSLPGSLRLILPGTQHLQDVGEPESLLWKSLPPVFYETATYNVTIEFDDVVEPPVVLHKLKEVTELFTTIPLGRQPMAAHRTSFVCQRAGHL